jgi:hypothetical protein
MQTTYVWIAERRGTTSEPAADETVADNRPTRGPAPRIQYVIRLGMLFDNTRCLADTAQMNRAVHGQRWRIPEIGRPRIERCPEPLRTIGASDKIDRLGQPIQRRPKIPQVLDRTIGLYGAQYTAGLQ